MKNLPGMAVILVLAACTASAKNDLGSFADARSAWPDAFRPGMVANVDLAGEALYAFAGEAESFFVGEFAESDAELFEEATLDAKARFYAAMSEGDPSRKVSLSGLRVAYRWTEGPMYRVVCVVPRHSVKVSPPPPPALKPPLSSDLPASHRTDAAPPHSPPASPSSGSGEPVEVAASTSCGQDASSDSMSTPVPDAEAALDETLLEARIRTCRYRLAESPDDPFLRLRLARLYAQAGLASRATRHYNALVKQLASDCNAMPPHDAAAAMVEAAEHARATGNDAQALKFFRSAWKLGDPDLQPRITAAIALLRLHLD